MICPKCQEKAIDAVRIPGLSSVAFGHRVSYYRGNKVMFREVESCLVKESDLPEEMAESE